MNSSNESFSDEDQLKIAQDESSAGEESQDSEFEVDISPNLIWRMNT